MISQIENIRLGHVYSYIFYVLCVIVFSIGLRILFSILRAWAAKFDSEKKAKYWYFYSTSTIERAKIIFKGVTMLEPYPDLWYNTYLGTIELLVFPVLMRVESVTIIGAWIGFKTVAQWPAWNVNRLAFNRYLLANALLMILSFLLMNWFIP